MNPSILRDTLVGLFVLTALAAIAYLSISVGGSSYQGPGGLPLMVTFDQIGGLKNRSKVVIGGVKVGRVTSVALDADLRARIALEVDGTLELPVDTSASILTSGVLGDQYIELEPGAEEELLQPGDEIEFSQSAVVLERLIGKLVQSVGSD